MSPAKLPDRLIEMERADYPSKLEDAAREELVWLWGDLAMARRYASGGCWSGECVTTTNRIVALSHLVGAIGWEEVDVELLLRTGLYERIHREAGIEYPPIDWDAVAAYEQWARENRERWGVPCSTG